MSCAEMRPEVASLLLSFTKLAIKTCPHRVVRAGTVCIGRLRVDDAEDDGLLF